MQMNGRRFGGLYRTQTSPHLRPWRFFSAWVQLQSIFRESYQSCPPFFFFHLLQDPLKLDIVLSFPHHGFHLRFDPWSQEEKECEGNGDMNVGSSVLPMMFWNLSCAGEITLSVAISAKLMTYNGVKKAREVVSY